MVHPGPAEPPVCGSVPLPPRDDLTCALCGERCWPDDFVDAAGEFICPLCLEEMIEAHHGTQ